MRQTSHRTWGWSKGIAPITWGADWDYCGTANPVVITPDSSPCCIHEALIVTSVRI